MSIPDSLLARVERDVRAVRNEYLFDIPVRARKELVGLLIDPKDIPLALLLSNIVVLVLPCAFLVASSGSHILGGLFLLVNYVIFLQRFLVALLHVSEHKPAFREGQKC